MRRRSVLLVLVAMALFAAGCSIGSGDDARPPVTDDDGAPVVENPGNPGTLVPPTVTTEAPEIALPIGPTVAFLDACVAELGLIGPCHCASERLDNSFSRGDLVVFEDRLSGRNEFSPTVAAALVDCRDAQAPAPWAAATIEIYLAGCTKGSARLDDLCRCSLSRAAEIIPEGRVAEFLDADDVRPGLVDLINTCI